MHEKIVKLESADWGNIVWVKKDLALDIWNPNPVSLLSSYMTLGRSLEFRISYAIKQRFKNSTLFTSQIIGRKMWKFLHMAVFLRKFHSGYLLVVHIQILEVFSA